VPLLDRAVDRQRVPDHPPTETPIDLGDVVERPGMHGDGDLNRGQLDGSIRPIGQGSSTGW